MVETQENEHDKEIFIDEMHSRRLTPSELSDDQVFRSELLGFLERIAKALEYIEVGIVHIKGEY